ncbi:MAG TPA: DUF5701 family protein [Micromonosporaceae bacterium]|nr:DUF5701 family protein [Micromonosporaceae bacterium]
MTDRRDLDLAAELDRQVENLVAKGYPELAGVGVASFRHRLTALKEQLAHLRPSPEPGRVPFVIVVRTDVVPADRAVSLVELRGKDGFTEMDADDLRRFATVEGVEIPPGSAYLLVDVDAGRGSRNVTPDEAGKLIAAEGRSPLTVAEGVALVTHHPEILRTGTCFSMLASRCGDRRVTAMWVSAGRPRLGWCWAGNPHTWLGSASCAARVGRDVKLMPGSPQPGVSAGTKLGG